MPTRSCVGLHRNRCYGLAFSARASQMRPIARVRRCRAAITGVDRDCIRAMCAGHRGARSAGSNARALNCRRIPERRIRRARPWRTPSRRWGPGRSRSPPWRTRGTSIHPPLAPAHGSSQRPTRTAGTCTYRASLPLPGCIRRLRDPSVSAHRAAHRHHGWAELVTRRRPDVPGPTRRVQRPQ
jgi:hypothetical protein